MKKVILLLFLLMIPFMTLALPKGDVDGNGKVASMDYILVRKHLLKQSLLTGDKLKRADVNSDGKVSSLDYIAIRKTIINGVVDPTATPKPTATPTPKPTNTPKPTATPTPKPTATPKSTYKKQFDITFFKAIYARNLDETQIKYMKEAGFTLASVEDWGDSVTHDEYVKNMDKVLKLLDKYGIRANVSDWVALWLNLGNDGGSAICSYSGDKLIPCIKQMINDYSKYSNVTDYFIKDEPNDISDSALYPLKQAINYIRNNDSGKEGYINLLPNYASQIGVNVSNYRSKYLEPFVKYVKPAVVSVDHYPSMFSGGNVNDSKIAYYANLKDIYDVSEKYNAIPMMIVLVTKHLNFKNLSRNEIAYQVSVSLAFGMRRISYFTYSIDDSDPKWSDSIIDRNHKRTQHYYDVQAVNKWAYKIGTYLFDKKNVGVYGFNEVSQISDYNKTGYNDIKASKAGIISKFSDHSYMLVNTEILPTPTDNTFTFSTMEGLSYYDTDSSKWVKITGNVSKDGIFSINFAAKKIVLKPGQCILLKGRYWEKDSKGDWYYYESNGSLIKNKWINENGKWYYTDESGKMVTGWKQITWNGKNSWFYFDNSGIMVSNKCLKINGTQYCFDEYGICTSNGC